MPTAGFLSDYLSVITGRGRCDGWIELRYRHDAGMRSRFYRARGPHHALAQTVARTADTRDVYIGCALRATQRGDREHIGQAWTVWAECDGQAAREALDAFATPPSLLVASGTPGHVHAYWALNAPIEADTLEDVNRRLAHAVCGDPVCFDAARILRPAGTRNHKHTPALPVRQIGPMRPEPYDLAELVDQLPSFSGEPAGGRQTRAGADDDPLLKIAPIHYVPALTGLTIGRDHKVNCPFHNDRTPSLHVYPSPEGGWYCYGCRRGGSVYDFGAELWHLPPRGSSFVRLRERLALTLLQ